MTGRSTRGAAGSAGSPVGVEFVQVNARINGAVERPPDGVAAWISRLGPAADQGFLRILSTAGLLRQFPGILLAGYRFAARGTGLLDPWLPAPSPLSA